MKITNPLTIIAIFSGTAEAFASSALVFLPTETQSIFIYFVMFFPLVIVIAFFIVLILKPHALDAPSDFANQEHFLDVHNLKASLLQSAEAVITEANKQNKPIDPKAVAIRISETFGESISTSPKQLIKILEKNPEKKFTLNQLCTATNLSQQTVSTLLRIAEASGAAYKYKAGDTTYWKGNVK